MAIHRGLFTPPPSFNQRPSYPPKSCKSDTRRPHIPPSPCPDRFRILHKVPSGDSPYARAKHVQLRDKEPSKAIPLFWRAINTGDRVDSALKDMAVVMKQLDRPDEAVEAIMSFRHLCSFDAQESLDNILIEMYKRSNRLDEEIEVLLQKVKRIEEDESIGGRSKKMARSQGRKVYITVEQEYSRLLGNLAWAYMQKNDYKIAADYYRRGLCIEPDRNKQCNLAICLMHLNKLNEAKILLNTIEPLASNQPMDESYAKSYERAHEMLGQMESKGVLGSFMKGKENCNEHEKDFDCQSQLDYIDNMCALGDASNPGSTLTTPVVTKWKKTAAYTDGSLPESVQNSSEQRLFTQPINRKQNRYLRSPCNIVFGKFEAPLTNGSEPVTAQRTYTNSEKSSPGSTKESCADQHSSDAGLLGRDPNDKNVWKSPSTVQQTEASDSCKGDNVVQGEAFPWPTWSEIKGKRWGDVSDEEEENSAAQMSSKLPSARRSLTYEHEKQNASNCASTSTMPTTPKALFLAKCSNGGVSSPREFRRLQVFCDITPGAENS